VTDTRSRNAAISAAGKDDAIDREGGARHLMNEHLTVLTGLDPSRYDTESVAVAMSGGVDSSLAAILLKEAGFDVVGLTMHLWDYAGSGGGGTERGCCDLSAIDGARRVAFEAGIPHYTVDLRDEFERLIVGDFIDEYLAGRTPNPCVRCNTFMKWEVLRRKARAIGCGLIATGHYARVARHGDGTFSLLAGVDPKKDQSYFLWGLDTEKLAGTIFPLGAMTKDQTRMEARKRNLATSRRRDSQEICFIPDDDYGRFLLDRHDSSLPAPLTEGDILDASGNVAGKHRGAAFYTIGQRRGLGLAMGKPVYVTAIDIGNNTVTVGDESELMSDVMRVTGIVWTRGFPPGERFGCTVKIRFGGGGTSSEVAVEPDGAVVRFERPQRAVTPGQSAVFYDGERVLGGGIIEGCLHR